MQLMESLENRTLLSAAAHGTVAVVEGVLIVQGDPNLRNHIKVSEILINLGGGRVWQDGDWEYLEDDFQWFYRVEGTSTTRQGVVNHWGQDVPFQLPFALNVHAGFKISGGNAADVIEVAISAGQYQPPLQIFGLDGNDTIKSGDSSDRIDGGAGNDRISGGAGDDLIYGRADHDRISGGAGNDTLLGGEGNDRLEGNDGDDKLGGALGTNIMLGGSGRDIFQVRSLSQNPQNDFLKGEDRVIKTTGEPDLFPKL